MSDLPVLIIGAGPTGMTAAMELSRLGVPLRIVDKAAATATTSRAIGVQARTLELFAQRGLIEPMLAKGNKGTGGSIYGEGKRIFRLDFANNGSEYPYILFISQAETEGVLRDALTRQNVTIEREVSFEGLADSEQDGPVTALLKHKDGHLEEVLCDYLIDSEGAHSIARTILNIGFEGKTRDEEYVLGDVLIDGDVPATDMHIFSSEHGFMGLFPLAQGHFRLIASNPLSKPNKDSAPSLEEIQQIYDQRSHIPARFHDMTWSSYFRINSRMVEKLHSKHVFFGGDSAHIHSPAGAQGMNTGIQDMMNLCWKLAYVIDGKADASLLDTYNDDRLPVIRGVLAQTETLTDAIGSENRLFRAAFSHIAPWIVSKEIVQENATERMSQLSLNYRSSSLSESHGTVGKLHAGDRIPNVEVAANGTTTKLFELLSTDALVLLQVNASEDSAQSSLSALDPWSKLLKIRAISSPTSGAEKYEDTFGKAAGLLLVRPDGYAAFTGAEDAIPALVKYLTKWFPIEEEARHA